MNEMITNNPFLIWYSVKILRFVIKRWQGFQKVSWQRRHIYHSGLNGHISSEKKNNKNKQKKKQKQKHAIITLKKTKKKKKKKKKKNKQKKHINDKICRFAYFLHKHTSHFLNMFTYVHGPHYTQSSIPFRIYLSHNVRNRFFFLFLFFFGHVLPLKIQIRLRRSWLPRIHSFLMRTTKTLIRLCVQHICLKVRFSRYGLFIFTTVALVLLKHLLVLHSKHYIMVSIFMSFEINKYVLLIAK